MFEDFTQCQNCENYDINDRLCKLFRCVKVCGCSSGAEHKPKNNFELLKSMSMNEMAEFLRDFAMCENTSLVWIKEWLKEATE